MPRPKHIDAYPKSFFSLLKKAHKGPVRVNCGGHRAAMNMRSELYTFRRVLYQNPSIAPLVAGIASELMFRVDGDDLVVEMRPHNKESLIARALEAS